MSYLNAFPFQQILDDLEIALGASQLQRRHRAVVAVPVEVRAAAVSLEKGQPFEAVEVVRFDGVEEPLFDRHGLDFVDEGQKVEALKE